jgi:hypothetical protein
MISASSLSLLIDVVILPEGSISLHDRVTASSGSQLVDWRTGALDRYEPGARIPRLPWRPVREDEQLRLFANTTEIDIGKTISVLKLPVSIDYGTKLRSRPSPTPALCQEFIGTLKASVEYDGPVIWLGRGTNSGDLTTVTVNKDIGKHIGLHIDNWDNAPLDSRHRSTNRLCVNIGEGVRYFLFAPITVNGMLRALKVERANYKHLPTRMTEIGRMFLSTFPEFPILRVALHPGEAYIAPTEN